MADIMSAETRSRLMSRIGPRNTKPELALRSLLHRAGFRFRLHAKDLPGKPDIVLPKYRTVIFVHGCFWHRHRGCRFATTPSSNKAFWSKKFSENVDRDKRKARALRRLGWIVLIVWECEVPRTQKMQRILSRLEVTARTPKRK